MLCNKRGIFIFIIVSIDSKINFVGALLACIIIILFVFFRNVFFRRRVQTAYLATMHRYPLLGRSRYTPSTAGCHRSSGDPHCLRRRRRRRRRESKSLINFFDLPASAVSVCCDRRRRRRLPRTIT